MSNAIRITALAALLLTPEVARAQSVAGSWPGLNVAALETVYVTDRDGRRTEGQFVGFDPDSVLVLVNGAEERFARERVARIDRRADSLRNGALIGAALGVVFGSISAGISDCPGDDPGGGCPGVRVGTFAGALGIYTALGTAVDAMIVGRTRVFDADQRRAARPILDGPQLAVRVSW
jgi:hypothetical protein